MTSLSPQSRSLIDDARPGEDLADGPRDRMKRKLMMNIAAGAAAAGATTAAAKATAGTAASFGLGSLSLLTKVGLSVTFVAAIGVGVGASQMMGDDAPAAPPQPVAQAPVDDAPAVEPGVAEPSVEEPSVAEPSVAAGPAEEAPAADQPAAEPGPKREQVAAPGAAKQAQRPSSSSIAAETSLLQRAQRELQSGDPEKALALLDEHNKAHKGGALREERQAARARALCKAGRIAQGRAAAQRFVAEFPRSPQRTRVLSACEQQK